MKLPAEQVSLIVTRRLLHDWYANRFVNVAADDHDGVVGPNSIYASACLLGVLAFDAVVGSDVQVKCGGKLYVQAGAPIIVGAEVVSDLVGLGVPRGSVATVRYQVVGRAMSPAANGELFLLDFRPYTVFGANAS